MQPSLDSQARGHTSLAIGFGGETVVLDARGVLYLPQTSTLIVADLHLEKGSAIGRAGSLIPPFDTIDTLARLEACIDDYQPTDLICLGDSLHDGNALARMNAADAAKITSLRRSIANWVWITGNHDPRPPAALAGQVHEQLKRRSVTLRHIPDKSLPGAQIAGHFHPKTAIRLGRHKLSGRCFLIGADLLIMPAFGAYTGGLRSDHASLRDIFAPDHPRKCVIFRQKLWLVA